MPEIIDICESCGGPIRDDDWYWLLHGRRLCERCGDVQRQGEATLLRTLSLIVIFVFLAAIVIVMVK